MSDLFSEHDASPICRDISRDISRGRANPQSAAAFERVAPHAPAMRERILELLRSRPDGMTSKEIAAAFGVDLHKVSPRIAEMRHKQHLIEPKFPLEERDGSAVLVCKN